MAESNEPLEFSLYRECGAGRFSHRDCTVAFYTRVASLLEPDLTLLSLGAGRGANILADRSPFRQKIQQFRGRVAKVIGIDIDAAVLDNPFVDEAHVTSADGAFPLADASVDVIVCDHVIEHVTNRESFVREVGRVLRPGGWFCARTPNKWGYIGLATRAVPNRLHVAILKRMQPHRESKDVFPTVYPMNTLSAVERAFGRDGWRHCSYGYDGAPGYHANSVILFRLIEFWMWLMPPALSAKLHIFIQKRAEALAV